MAAATDGITDYALSYMHAGPQVSHCAERQHCTGLEVGVETTGFTDDVHRLTEDLMIVTTNNMNRLIVTRMRSETGTRSRYQIDVQDSGYCVQLHLRELARATLWQEEPPIVNDVPVPRGGVIVLEYQQTPAIYFAGSFDALQFHVSHATLREFAQESGSRTPETLRWPLASTDHGLHRLGMSMVFAFDHPELPMGLFREYLVLATYAYIACRYGGVRVAPRTVRGGLARWQVRRATEMLREAVASDVSLRQVAAECHLSTSHFMRSFKQSLGKPPYQWLLEQRIEAAKTLLRNPELTIAAIAQRCGFADHPCLTRAFKRALNVTPGEWRRTHLLMDDFRDASFRPTRSIHV